MPNNPTIGATDSLLGRPLSMFKKLLSLVAVFALASAPQNLPAPIEPVAVYNAAEERPLADWADQTLRTSFKNWKCFLEEHGGHELEAKFSGIEGQEALIKVLEALSPLESAFMQIMSAPDARAIIRYQEHVSGLSLAEIRERVRGLIAKMDDGTLGHFSTLVSAEQAALVGYYEGLLEALNAALATNPEVLGETICKELGFTDEILADLRRTLLSIAK